MKHAIDIIIPTYNNCEELQLCLKGFEQQSFNDFRIIVCVDGSTDNTIDYLQIFKGHSKVDLLVVHHADGLNHGRNATRNLALPHLNSDFLLLCDSDAIPRSNFVQCHFDVLSIKECISVGDLEYSNANSNLWAAYLHTRGKRKYSPNDEVPFHYATTGNMGLKTEWFISLGGQDEAMRTYGGGDTEFAYRLRKQYNAPVIYNRSAIADSTMTKTIEFALNQMEEFGRINLPYIRKKHPNFNEIYKVGLLDGTDVKSRLFRLLLNPLLGNISHFFARILPISIAIPFLAHAVGSKVLKGFTSSK